MLSDLRLAVRSLAKSPGFTAIAILIVAVGIGAATAMFSTVNALVLRPVALPAPERLVAVYETNLARNVPWFSNSYPNYVDWRDRSQSWESLGAAGWDAMNLTGGSEPEFVNVRTMTATLLPTLGLVPALGRGFLPEEDRPGQNRVAILSHAFWQRHFGGTREAVGQTLLLNGIAHTVVGVLPAGAFFPGDLEIGIPMGLDAAAESRTNHDFDVYGRLKPGVTIEQADAEMKAIAAQIAAGLPETERGWSTRLNPLMRDLFAPQLRTALFALLGAVALLLMIACANLSNLLVVRAAARTHELAIRSALGASRFQVVRQIATESLAIAVAGGLLGIVLSLWTVDLARTLSLPRASEISVDLRVLAVAVTATFLAGLLSGLGPALQASRAKPLDALKTHAPRSGHRSRFRATMIVVQIAFSLTLLIGAALLGRSFLRLVRVDPGFNPENVLTVSLRPVDNPPAIAFYERLTERVRGLPGVAQAGLIHALPFTPGNTSLNVYPQGESNLLPGESLQSNWRLVDGGFFAAMQIPVLRGQSFENLKPAEARRSVVISASLARALWGDADPIGRQLDPGGGGRLLTVIGVVGDVRSQSLGTAPAPTFYWSMHRFLYGPMRLVVRSDTDPAPLLAAIRAIAKEIDSTVPVFAARTLEDLRGANLERERIVLALLGAFAALALFLATLGTYGVVAFSVQQRTNEIGIRIAIGAQASDILRLVLGQGLRLLALGVALGLTAAFALTRLFASVLYDTPSSHLPSYLLATAVLIAAALAACWFPARRATKVDPMTALRAE